MARRRKNTTGKAYSKPEKYDKYKPHEAVKIDDLDPESIIDKGEIAAILSGEDIKREDKDLTDSVTADLDNAKLEDDDKRADDGSGAAVRKNNEDADDDLGLTRRERTPFQKIGAATISFIRHNSTIFTALVSIAIVVETAIVIYQPESWWIPLVTILVLGVAALLWANARFVIKLIGTLAVFVMCMAFAVMSGSALQRNNMGGLVWASFMLAGFAVSLFASYCVRIDRSRWVSIGVGSVIGFCVGYAFIPFGLFPAAIADAITMVLASVIVMMSPLTAFFRNRRFPKPSPLTPEQLSLMINSMDSLSPRYTYGFLDKKSTILVFHAENLPTYVFIPVRFDKSFKTAKKRGLIYKGVRFDTWLRRKMMKIEGKLRTPTPVTVILDVNGMNEDANEDAVVIDVPIVDSVYITHAGMVGMKKSRRPMRSKIRRMYEKFGAAKVANVKQDGRTSKILNPYDEKYALECQKKADEDSEGNYTVGKAKKRRNKTRKDMKTKSKKA